jgi:hypothetical protein
MEQDILGTGDVIYLSQGRNQGIKAGDEFAVIRETRMVKHPETGKNIGHFIMRLGRARVLVTQESTATAVIEFACEDIHRSDELVPWKEIPIPEIEALPPFDRYDPEPSGLQIGRVVYLADDRSSVATGHIIQTDLGVASGVVPGQILKLFRTQAELPRRMIGQAVILTVEPMTSAAKIMHSVRETEVADHIEVVE